MLVLKNKRGFSVLEVVAVTAMLLVVAAILLPAAISFNNKLEYIVARNLTYTMASDIRRTQALDMYRTQQLYGINFDTARGGYFLMQQGRVIERNAVVAQLNEGWVLEAVNRENAFYAGGAVNAYNYINLYTRKNIERGYRIQVLPVSGRVGVEKR